MSDAAEHPETHAPELAAAEEEEETQEEKKLQSSVSHSPLNVSNARARFEQAQQEEPEPQITRRASHGPRAPKPKDGKYTYEQLKMPGSQLTKEHIDVTKRETYLGTAEFAELFGCSPEEFAALPKWKQDKLKREKGLF